MIMIIVITIMIMIAIKHMQSEGRNYLFDLVIENGEWSEPDGVKGGKGLDGQQNG